MPLLPYRRIELRSPLSALEVVQALSGAVEPRRWLRFGWGTLPFEGTVTHSGFSIQRIIRYRNAFLPRIRGSVASEPSVSRISITLRLHGAVMVFLVLWLGVLLASAVALVRSAAAASPRWESALFLPGLLFLGWLLVFGSFSYESRKAVRLIKSLVRGRDVAIDGPQRKR